MWYKNKKKHVLRGEVSPWLMGSPHPALSRRAREKIWSEDFIGYPRTIVNKKRPTLFITAKKYF
jgi:hypothetical protein